MSTLNLFSDGSAVSRPYAAGGGLAILHHDNWSFFSYSFDDATDSSIAEYKAILKAFEAAVCITTSPHHNITQIMLHTDSQGALSLLNRRQNTEQRTSGRYQDEIADRCLAAMIILDAEGIACEGQWVWGHSGEEGNVHADRLAKYGLRKCRLGLWDVSFEIDDYQMEEIVRAEWAMERQWMVVNHDPWEGDREEAREATGDLFARVDHAEVEGRRLQARWTQVELRLLAARRVDERNMWLAY